MGNLYRLNSLFELEITRPIEEISQNPSLLERNTVYEYLFLVISKEDDFTILSEPASKELLEYWKEIVFHSFPSYLTQCMNHL